MVSVIYSTILSLLSSSKRNSEKPKSFNHKFSLQLYSSKQLKEMLLRAGFEALEQYETNGSVFVEKESTTILLVVQKQKSN